MTAREAVSLLFRYKKFLLICFYAPLVIGILLYLHQAPSYLASAKILISSYQEESAQGGLDQGGGSGGSLMATKQEAINSELEIINSTDLADAVIQHFGVNTLFPRDHWERSDGSFDRDHVLSAFSHALTADPVKNSNVIDVNYEAASPELAREVLAWVLTCYQQKHNAAYSVPVATFLDSQLATMDQRIDEIDTEEAAYKASHNLFDAAQQRQETLQEINDLKNTAAQLRSHVAEMGARILALKQVAAATPETVESYAESEQSDAESHAQSELLDLQVQEKQLEARYNNNSVALQTVRSQIDAVNAFLRDQSRQFSGAVRTSRNPLYDELEAEIARAQIQLDPDTARAAVLDQQIASMTQQLGDLERAQIYIGGLERERSSIAEALQTYRQRQTQAQLVEQLSSQQATSIRIIEDATSSSHHYKPRGTVYLGISLGLGLLAALVAAAIIFATRNTFIVPEGLERAFKIPVIASLPDKPSPLLAQPGLIS